MHAWRLDRLGGALEFCEVPMPETRPGSVLVRIEASLLMSYLKAYVEGKLGHYSPPATAFTPGGNGVGVIEAVGQDVWHLKPGQRVFLSSHLVARENVAEPAQILLGITAFDAVGHSMQRDWPNGTLAEFALWPAAAVTPVDDDAGSDAAHLALFSRCAIPLGGLLRGRLAAGETIIVNGATGAYGTAAILVALALGAARVIAAGRDRNALDALTQIDPERIAGVRLSGSAEDDAAELRAAAGGGAQLAFDMVGGASDPNSTLAALYALARQGRLVLMGSMSSPLPLSYARVMANNWEVIGHFMFPADAYQRLNRLHRAKQLHLGALVPIVFPLSQLPEAMEAATRAQSLECVVVVP